MKASVPLLSHFDELYAARDDPWGVESRFTERSKRAVLLMAVGPKSRRTVLELGCGNGILTRDLSARFQSVVALDGSRTAIARALLRTRGKRNVILQRATLPDQFPEGSFDVIIASEILYYLPFRALETTLRQIKRTLRPRGLFIAVHHVRRFSDAASSASEVETVTTHALGSANCAFVRGAWRLSVHRG